MADQLAGATEWVLVYGTLKRGHPNHHQLAGAPCLGVARLDGLALHDLGPFPMAVPAAGQAPVIGELYRLNAATLSALDRFEGVPRLYRRWRWRSHGGRWVWVYLGDSRQIRHAPRIVDGIWTGSRRPRRQDGLRTGGVSQDR